MKMKRFLSTLLAICMLVGLMPAASAEASATVLNVLEVSGLPHEVAGKNTADMLTFDVPEGVTYEVEWEDADWNNYEGVLEIGGTYNLVIYLHPEEGYSFDLEAEVLLDVDESVPYVDLVYTHVAETDYTFIRVCYDLNDSMPEVEINGITTPVTGQLPTVEGLSVPQGADYSIESAQWYYWNENDEWTAAAEAFVGGRDYYLELDMALPVGFAMDINTAFTFDVEAGIYDVSADVLTVHFYVPGVSVSEVFVEGVPDEIQAGQQASTADITIPADAPYTLEASWQTAVDGDWTTFEGTFQENSIYRLNLEFYPAEGYQMDVEEIYVNGALADYYGQSSSWLGMEILYPLTQEISAAELLGVQEPVAGENADASAIQVPEGANYSIEYAYWYDTDTYEAVTGSFEKGKTYALDVKLVPDEGYHFAQEVVLTVNGQASDEYYSDLLYVNYWHEASLKELIERVDITGVVEPVIGQAPVTEGVTAENCEVYVSWQDENGDEVELFEDGKRYTVDMELYPAEGYRFSEDTVITIDGEAPNSFNYAYDSYGYISNTYSFCEVIPSVSVQMPSVSVGQAVPTEAVVPEGANYYASITWYTWSEKDGYTLFEDAVLTEGKLYNMDLYIYPVDGYGFDPEQTEVEIIGADPVVNIGESAIYAMFNYNFSTMPEIEKVELTNVQLPEIGTDATTDGIGIPENANYTITELLWMESATGDVNGMWEVAETFREGMYYMLYLMVQTEQGYIFDWKVPVYINGEQAEIMLYDGDCFKSCLAPVSFGPLEGETAAVTGDFTGDGAVNNEDVVYLLWHTLFVEDFPITSNGDFTGDGVINNEDVVYMLWYTLFPEDFPLE